VISCFTFNNKDHSWGADQEGELTIAKIAQAIIQRWSPDGLAAWPVLKSVLSDGPATRRAGVRTPF